METPVTDTSIRQAAHLVATLTPRGVWPPNPSVLPYFLTEDDLAHLLDRSLRTLERQRRDGTSPPFTVLGKGILYPRDAVVEHLLKSTKPAMSRMMGPLRKASDEVQAA
jgi:hypothetical protein